MNDNTDMTTIVVENASLALQHEEAIQAILTGEIPKSAIRERAGRGGKTFRYVDHGHVTQILNRAFRLGWSFQAMPETLTVTPEGAGIFGRLIVYGPRYDLETVEFGWKDASSAKGMQKGDMIKSAVSDSLRRCAMRLGVGLCFYTNEEEPTANEILGQLVAFAKNNLDWTKNETAKFLKEHGFSSENIVERLGEAYHLLAEQAGKTQPEATFEEVETDKG